MDLKSHKQLKTAGITDIDYCGCRRSFSQSYFASGVKWALRHTYARCSAYISSVRLLCTVQPNRCASLLPGRRWSRLGSMIYWYLPQGVIGMQELTGLAEWQAPCAGMFLWLDLSASVHDADEVFAELLQRKVCLRKLPCVMIIPSLHVTTGYLEPVGSLCDLRLMITVHWHFCWDC